MASPEEKAADAFRTCLLNLAGYSRPPEPLIAEEQSQQFRAALILASSESRDNKNCAESLEIGELYTNFGRTHIGLRLRGTDIAVSSVLWHSEGRPIPAQVSEVFPELSQPQWEACLRLATLVLSAFESIITADGRDPSSPENLH